MLAKNWALMRTLRVDLKRSAVDSAGEAYCPVGLVYEQQKRRISQMRKLRISMSVGLILVVLAPLGYADPCGRFVYIDASTLYCSCEQQEGDDGKVCHGGGAKERVYFCTGDCPSGCECAEESRVVISNASSAPICTGANPCTGNDDCSINGYLDFPGEVTDTCKCVASGGVA